MSSADFRNSIKSYKQLGSRSGPTFRRPNARLFVGPNMGPTCLEMSLVMPIGSTLFVSILRPTLVNICSRRLKQITFSEAFFSVKVLRKTKLEWFDVVTRLLNNKYSSLRHIYKRGFTSDSADAQTEINFCSILTLKYSMYVVSLRLTCVKGR